MSKKMMKRSLALGALMAFVITGSAMAADYDAANGPYNDKTITMDDGHHAYGAFSKNGDIVIDGATFTNNKVVQKVASKYSYGGALYVIGNLTITDSYFINNKAEGMSASVTHGGAVCHQDGTLNITNTVFEGNKTNFDGGYGSAIYSSGTGDIHIEGCTFENQDDGRAVYIRADKTATFVNNTFSGNIRGCVQAEDTNTKLVFAGTNTFDGSEESNAIKNKGTTTFAEGSTSIFTNNERDIDNTDTGTVNINNSFVSLGSGIEGKGTTNINGGTLEIGADSEIGKLGGAGGNIKVGMADESNVAKVQIGEFVQGADESKFVVGATGAVTDYIAGLSGDAQNAAMASVFASVTVDGDELAGDTVTTDEGLLAGAYTITRDGDVITSTQAVNTKQDAVSDAGMTLKGHWRAHMNDMNKRMGELRNANGESGVWTRMVRGESEYQGAKMQYNQYQLGYDEKLSVDKRWTVGAAVTFSEGDASYGTGSTEDKSTAFAIYGSKLNNDGTFVDLIARYARIESDLDDCNYGTGDYDANGYSVSAEFGKRIQQGNGLWIEPQVELTYGSVDGAKVNFSKNFTANYDSMDSFVARAGFALGKDIKQGNVYARASYLYDFDGETKTQFEGGKAISEDFGGGWWEVGVGANINLSKATYIYADVEKTFGGEVDTNWQWNLGVRYSF